MKIRYIFSLACAFLLFSVQLTANESLAKQEFKRTVNKEYDISADGSTHFINKYGQMDIKTWEQNKVKINITIVVNARNENIAQEVFERINIDFVNSSSMVKAETKIESGKNMWSWWKNTNADYKINYDILIPETVRLEANQRYGDVFISGLDNEVDLQVKYGNFQVGDVDACRISLAYGKGTLGRCDDLTGDLSYFNMEVDETADVDVSSKYSTLRIHKAQDLSVEAAYDNYYLGTVNDLDWSGKYGALEIESVNDIRVESKYTGLKIGDFDGRGDFTIGYGGLTINNVKSQFSSLTVESQYAGIKLGMDENTNYTLDVVTRYASIDYPDAVEVSTRIQESYSKEIIGKKGSGGSLIKIRSRYGNVKIR